MPLGCPLQRVHDVTMMQRKPEPYRPTRYRRPEPLGTTAGKFSEVAYDVVMKRIRDIPSLPQIINELIVLLGKPNVAASEIAKLVSYDPGLTTRVLRMVNSASYGLQRQVSSIQHGIMILGFNTVRGLILSASIFKLFENQHGHALLDHTAFWHHSLSTALIAKTLATHYRIPEVDDAFCAGMLHDVGKIVLDVYFNADYSIVLSEAKKECISPHGSRFLALEQQHLGTTHAHVGHMLAEKWKLPVTIQDVIEYHHHPDAAIRCPALVHCVAFANAFANIHREHSGIIRKDFFSPGIIDYYNLDDAILDDLKQLLANDLASVDNLIHAMSTKR
jgi:putative nucleotidyltransferase with HDIG domain